MPLLFLSPENFRSGVAKTTRMVIIMISTWGSRNNQDNPKNRPGIAQLIAHANRIMAAVIPPLRKDQSRPHRVRVKQGTLSGLEGTLIEELDDDRVLIALGADIDAANNRARGAYIAIGAAAVELL